MPQTILYDEDRKQRYIQKTTTAYYETYPDSGVFYSIGFRYYYFLNTDEFVAEEEAIEKGLV
jgi:hypothetical protein